MNHRAYSLLEVKDVSAEKRTIYGWATTPSPDRVGDVVDQYGITVAPDIPLFLYHDSEKVVGRASFGKPTAKGIPFEAQLPKVTEPGALKDRVDEAWSMVTHRLLQCVSIGFRALKDGYELMKDGGIKYTKTEVLELSLVPVPAQSDAVITSWKSMDELAQRELLSQIKSADQASLRAASGASRGGVVRLDGHPPNPSPGVSGTPNKPAFKRVFLRPERNQS